MEVATAVSRHGPFFRLLVVVEVEVEAEARIHRSACKLTELLLVHALAGLLALAALAVAAMSSFRPFSDATVAVVEEG
jgi:hypothetical protein